MWFVEFIESKHVIAKVKITKELVGVVMVREAIGAAERWRALVRSAIS